MLSELHKEPLMPDFETMGLARFEMSRVDTALMEVPAGNIGVQPSHCDNPDCEDHCPSVWITVRLELQTLHIRLDAKCAAGVAAMMLHSAHVADPSLKDGAN
jgi:Fe-S-cluster-containing hydrogenase component 2